MKHLPRTHPFTGRATVVALAVALLTTGLAACSGGEEAEQPSPCPSAVEEAEDSAAEDADEAGDGTAAPSDGGGTEPSGDDPAVDDAGLTVTADGRGAMILRVTGTGGGDESRSDESVEGKLITGPGGCLAVQPGGQPELLLFPESTDFVDDPPRVTVEGAEARGGEQLSATATRTDLGEVDGVPEQCARGAAPSARVIGG